MIPLQAMRTTAAKQKVNLLLAAAAASAPDA